MVYDLFVSPHNNKTCVATNYCSHSKCTVAAAYMNSYRYCNKMRITGILLFQEPCWWSLIAARCMASSWASAACPFRTLKTLKVNTITVTFINMRPLHPTCTTLPSPYQYNVELTNLKG